jgi:large subunit ribosomal protein L1
MGKKRNIVMDQTQEEMLDQHSDNKYSSSGSAFDLPEEFALISQESEKGSEQKQDKEKPEKATKKVVKKVRSKKYKSLKKQIKSQEKYSLEKAIKKILELAQEKFDSSIELHLQMKRDGLSGNFELPHGTGKSKKIVIFDEKLAKKIESKKIDFDLIIAKPEDMSKLAKHAKFLGPRGLMPNPKNGTISPDPEKALKSLSGNKLSYKTEKKAPLIHLTIGKKSFGDKKLIENIKAVFDSINPRQIKKASISSSMSPGIRLDFEKLS